MSLCSSTTAPRSASRVSSSSSVSPKGSASGFATTASAPRTSPSQRIGAAAPRPPGGTVVVHAEVPAVLAGDGLARQEDVAHHALVDREVLADQLLGPVPRDHRSCPRIAAIQGADGRAVGAGHVACLLGDAIEHRAHVTAPCDDPGRVGNRAGAAGQLPRPVRGTR